MYNRLYAVLAVFIALGAVTSIDAGKKPCLSCQIKRRPAAKQVVQKPVTRATPGSTGNRVDTVHQVSAEELITAKEIQVHREKKAQSADHLELKKVQGKLEVKVTNEHNKYPMTFNKEQVGSVHVTAGEQGVFIITIVTTEGWAKEKQPYTFFCDNINDTTVQPYIAFLGLYAHTGQKSFTDTEEKHLLTAIVAWVNSLLEKNNFQQRLHVDETATL